MTKEQAIDIIKCLAWHERPDEESIEQAIEALEQQPSDDVMAIHTQGLDEGIRCAMCTNSMKSDRGCDGGCVVDNKMYKKVMDTIHNHIFEQPTSDDCISRQAVLDKKVLIELPDGQSFYCIGPEDVENMPPVTPTRCIATVRFSKEDLRDICNERIEIECTHGTCKDCKYCEDIGVKGTFYCKRYGINHLDGYYCADYEKRGSENE